jgi:hypothetical protein
MKLKYYILGAVASTALALSSSALAGITVNDTDLLVFFQDASQGNNLVLDMGPLSGLHNGQSFSIGADLNYFGASGAWSSDSSLIWSVIGVDENDGGSTNGNSFNYATDWIGSKGTSLTEKGSATQGGLTDYVSGNTYGLLGGVNATSGANSQVVFVNKTVSGAYEDIYSGAGGDITSIWGSATQQSGVVNTSSLTETLYQLEPEDTNGGTILPSSTNEGTFTLSNNGDITYNTASDPEPATWASIVIGAASLLAFRRRRA